MKNKNLFENNSFNNFVSGSMAGLACTTIVTPIERVKILKQTQIYFNSLFSFLSLSWAF